MKKVRYSDRTIINFDSCHVNLLNYITNLNTGTIDFETINNLNTFFIDKSEEDKIKSVLDENNERERNIINILSYYLYNEALILNWFVDENWTTNLAKGCKRYNEYLSNIKYKEHIDYTHRIVGQGKPEFKAEGVLYKVIADNSLLNDKEREKVILRMILYEIVLGMKGIKEYRLYDLKRNEEYRVQAEEIEENVKNRIRIFSKIYERKNGKVKLLNTKNNSFKLNSLKVYTYGCPCGLGFYKIAYVHEENISKEGSVNSNIEPFFMCDKCKEKYRIIFRNKKHYLESDDDELFFKC